MRHYTTRIASLGFVLRKMAAGGLGACAMFATNLGNMVGAVRRPNLLQSLQYAFSLVMVPLLVLAVLAGAAYALGVDHHTVNGVLMAAPAVIGVPKAGEPKKPARIREMETQLKALAKELELGQTEMEAGPLPQGRGEELQQKAQEMEELQTHIDQYNHIAGITSKARETKQVTLPSTEERNRKTVRTTAGHLFIASEAYRRYIAKGKHDGWMDYVVTKGRLGKPVTLRGEEAMAFESKAFDSNDLSDLGGTDALIQTDRDPELVRYAEPEILTLRDILNVVQTGSDSIKYVKQVSTTRGAKSQAERGDLKEFLKVAFQPQTVSVETIAVLSKVTEQDIADAPRLVGLINGEMALDIKVEEERQIARGSGEDGELLGLFDPESGIDAIDAGRLGEDDTIIDIIRKMRTDLRKRRVTPNFVSIDPLDWEQVELIKGSDDRYVWGLVTDLRGPRIWSLRVIESDAMTNLENDERRILMGDGIRGATLYDRMTTQLAVGTMDDDFGRNLRTLRAEERVAMAIKRAWAFEYAITQVASS